MSSRLDVLAQQLQSVRFNPISMPHDVKDALIRDFAFASNCSIPSSTEMGRIYDKEQGRT